MQDETPQPQNTPGARVGWLVALVFVAIGGGWTIFVPLANVTLIFDQLSYAAQGWSLAQGVLGMDVGARVLPTFYPLGVPTLLAGSHEALGDDPRLGIRAIWLCAVIGAALCAWGASRIGGVRAAVITALILLGSPSFHVCATSIFSQQPTLAATILSLLLFVRARGFWLAALAGFVASLTLLLRYANVTLPAALVVAELWPRRGGWTWSRVFGLGTGLALGAGVVLWHNAAIFGSPFVTGYSRGYGEALESSAFSLSNILSPTTVQSGADSALLMPLLGFGRLYTPPVALFALVGLWSLFKGATCERRTAWAVITVFAVQCTFLAAYYFRSELYIFTLLGLVAPLAAIGVVKALSPRLVVVAALIAGAWAFYVSEGDGENVTPAFVQARARHEMLARASEAFDDNAVMISGGEVPLVGMVFVGGTERRMLCYGPFKGGTVLFDTAVEELEGRQPTPPVIATYVARKLAEGRRVYFDVLPPARFGGNFHKQLRVELKRFARVPTDVEGVVELVRRNG